METIMCEDKKLKPCNLEDSFGAFAIDQETVDQKTNNSDEALVEIEDGMPTLVAKIFIESITDVELLKKFRFINKYWNCEACVALRKLSSIELSMLDVRTGLENFLVLQNTGQSLSLPSPFKNVSVLIHCTQLSKYQDICHDLFYNPNFEIKYLFVNFDRVTDLGQLKALLKLKAAEITELEFRGAEFSSLQEAFSEVKLPFLQALNIMELYCPHEDCDHVELIRKTTMASPLTNLEIKIHASPCFSSFLSMDLTRITKLHLDIELYLEKKHWDSLAAAQFPSLKFLKLHNIDNDYLLQICSFYRNISSTVEYLKLDSLNVLGTCVYPKLKGLAFERTLTSQELGSITQEMFPQLKDIGVNPTFNPNDLPALEINPLDGVQKLSASIDTIVDNDNMQMAEDWPSRTGISALATKFPNVNNLRIHFLWPAPSWSSSQFLNVYHAYPHLKSFGMYGNVSFEILAGATLQELNAKWPERNFPRRISIVDFYSLQSLYLEPDDGVSNELIQYCLARIPNLRNLKFAWNGRISLEVVRDFLQHLLTLELSNSYHWRHILIELRTVLPWTKVKGSPR